MARHSIHSKAVYTDLLQSAFYFEPLSDSALLSPQQLRDDRNENEPGNPSHDLQNSRPIDKSFLSLTAPCGTKRPQTVRRHLSPRQF
jgi:hypothetical protein